MPKLDNTMTNKIYRLKRLAIDWLERKRRFDPRGRTIVCIIRKYLFWVWVIIVSGTHDT